MERERNPGGDLKYSEPVVVFHGGAGDSPCDGLQGDGCPQECLGE